MQSFRNILSMQTPLSNTVLADSTKQCCLHRLFSVPKEATTHRVEVLGLCEDSHSLGGGVSLDEGLGEVKLCQQQVSELLLSGDGATNRQLTEHGHDQQQLFFCGSLCRHYTVRYTFVFSFAGFYDCGGMRCQLFIYANTSRNLCL